MQQVQLPSNVLFQLGTANSELQVVDDSGAVKGYLISPEYRELIYSWVKTLFADDEELAQARADVGGYTTPEAIAYLRDVELKFKSSQP